uniref:Bacterial Pleckstrin homology domain-containing protein n=1 Tax=uncultured bacterium contig00023(2014) TaxID=1465628 RepID=A0A060CW06_9BACT|nr:hypothetical protein [uncultured bacterium contig00023(2014)]
MGLFMDIFVVVFAAIWVGMGLFCKKYPDTISGYSTMSREKRKNVDIQAVANLIDKGFQIMVGAMLVLYFVFRLLGMPVVAMIAWIASIFVGTAVLLVMTQKYDKNPRGKFLKYLPSAITMLLAIGIPILMAVGIPVLIATGAQPSKAIIGEDSVTFTGQYGIAIQLDDIAKCELWDDIPRITARTNGLGLGDICKGDFRLDSLGKCRLFIKLGDTPYLYIETKDGRKIIFNSPDPPVTESLFEALRR